MNSSFVMRRARWLLLLFTALVYLRALIGDFVWDDRTFFVENDILPNLKPWDLKSILLQPSSYWGENLPLSEFLFVLEYYLFGGFTPAYHVVSLILYLVVGLLVWKFVGNIYERFGSSADARLRGAPDRQISILWVSSLFLLHPAHVEVVAYITGQQHLLYALFSLLSMNILWAAWSREELHRKGALVAAITCYYLAVLAKYQAVSIGLFIPLLWFVLRRKGAGNPLKTLFVWGLINIPVALWLRFSTGAYSDLGKTELPFLVAAARGIRILGAHLIIALKPHPLNFGYPFDHSWSFDINFLAGSLVLCGLLTSLVFFRRSITTVGLLIFVVCFFPILQIFVDVSNATIYDRYLFLPILGVCLVFERCLAAVVSKWKGLRWTAASLAVALTLVLAALTFGYIPKFRSDLASLEHAYNTFPGWKRAAFDYEITLIEAGLLDEAMGLAEKEETFSRPNWVRSYFRGRVELERGNLARAITHLERASQLIHQGGYFPFTGVPLGRAYIQTGQLDRAEIQLREVLISPINQPIERFRANRLLAEIKAQRASK